MSLTLRMFEQFVTPFKAGWDCYWDAIITVIATTMIATSARGHAGDLAAQGWTGYSKSALFGK